MDGELLRWLYHRLLDDPNLARTPNCTYGDGLVALVYFFGALNGRSVLWASNQENWPLWCRRLKLPSCSQLNKRLKTLSILSLINQINIQLRERLGHGLEKVVDGKPLVVGGYSHDPDARLGKVPDGWARGYKLHVVIDIASGAIDGFAVTALDAGESTVLKQMIPTLQLCGVTLRGDANYDSNSTYQMVSQAGGRLIAPRRKPGTALGHQPHHPHRLNAIAELEGSPSISAAHKRSRNRVEQVLGHLTNLPFGLAPLPNFVRRLSRVSLWVTAKIILYHLHHVLIRSQAAAA
jgi:hypothetical protein